MATPGMAAGTTIGDYRILSRLGAGGMGVVYLAEDVRLQRRVALKALPAEFARDPDRRRRFLQEARAAAALSHAGIAAVYELEERGEELFIIYEYIEGDTLRARVEVGGMPPDTLLEIALQVAQALEAAHARGIVHRDLKPENVMVRATGEPKILDFGLARFDSGVLGGQTTQSFGLTQAGTVMGTVGYMSPEQLQGKAVDFRSDLFAFGVMLYELAAGTHPFSGATPASTIANVLTQEPPPLTAASAVSPPELDRIVRKCLRKSPDERYQSTRELVVDLKNLKHDSGASRAVTAPLTAAVPASPRAHKWWLAHSFFFLAYVPIPLWFAWKMKDWAPEPVGLTMFFGVIATLAIATAIRMVQLNFALWSPEGLAQQVRLTAPWLTLANLASLSFLLVMAANVYVQHTGFAALVTGVCVVGFLTVLVYEPQMVRHAFPGTRPLDLADTASPQHIAGIQWAFLLLLASPAVDFALGSKPMEELVGRAADWPLGARVAAAAGLVAMSMAALLVAAWSAEAWQQKREAFRTLVRRFPLFLTFDLCAAALWAAWLAVRQTPRPAYLLLFLLAYLPFHQRKLAAGLAPVGPGEGEVTASQGRILAALQGVFALIYAGLGIAASQMLQDALTGVALMPRPRETATAVIVVIMTGFFLCAASATGFLTQPQEKARTFLRFFPGFAAANILAGIALGAFTVPLLNSFLLFFVVSLAVVPVTFYERRLARELAPAAEQPQRRDPRITGLAAINGLFAVMFAVLSFFTTELMGRIFVEPNWQTHHKVVAVVRASLAVIGLLLSAGFAVQSLRSPVASARRFVQVFPAMVLLNVLGGILAGVLSALFLGSYLLAVLLPIVIIPMSFYARYLARELAPAEARAAAPAAAHARVHRWWILHQLSNLLVLAPWVGYWGWLTRDYFGAFSRLVFLALVLAVAAAWSFNFVRLCGWVWNRRRLPEMCARLAVPTRYIGFAIVGLMLVQAGMAAVKDNMLFATGLGALAIGGLVSILYIEPALEPPAE